MKNIGLYLPWMKNIGLYISSPHHTALLCVSPTPMATRFSHTLHFCHFSSSNMDPNKHKHKLYCVKINGNKSLQVENVVTSLDLTVFEQQIRQNIPTKKQLADPHRQAIMADDDSVLYRQIVVVRSYEVGPDKTATIETILNLLQETALNHVWMSGLLSDGFGATHEMMRNNLIWVVSRMQVQVDHYPIWGEVMEIDTWVGASGKNGMRRDWILRSKATGLVFARATSTWVMMNRLTRRLSKMPDEVRAEISPWFIEKQAIKEETYEKIEKLDNKARYARSNLRPKRGDLDMNHHVNNVKYIRWMFETIPDEFLENHQLSEIIMEYRRECGISDVVQSLCQPQQDDALLEAGIHQQSNSIGLNGHGSVPAGILEGNGLLGFLNQGQLSYTHLLQVEGQPKNEEIVRGKTAWKKKLISANFPL